MCFRLMMTSLKQMKEIWKEDVNKQLISKNISCHDEKHITHDICRHLETLFFLLSENAKKEWCNLQILQASAVLRSLSEIQ